MKKYIVSYDVEASVFSGNQFTSFISENKHVAEWVVPYRGAVLIRSQSDIVDLLKSINKFAESSAYFIAEVDISRTAGLLKNEIWNWFNTGELPKEDVDRLSNDRLTAAAYLKSSTQA